MKNSMLEYKGYHASVEFDAEDNIFVGEVFGITDSLNFHGESVDELKEMFAQCIDNYLEICEQIGKQPDKEFKGTFNVRITPELHKRADIIFEIENKLDNYEKITDEKLIPMACRSLLNTLDDMLIAMGYSKMKLADEIKD